MIKNVGIITSEYLRDSVIPEFHKIDGMCAVDIPIAEVVAFNHHPFKVIDDEAMEMLKQSIEQQGILVPIIVRRKNDGRYEIISGHRRVFVARMLGYDMIPAVVKKYTDDEAVIAMVDANLQRELLPSEKANAFKMRLEAIKHQGSSRRDVAKSISSADVVGDPLGISGRQVQRYIKLTKLTRKMMNLVDERRISIEHGNMIADLSYATQDLLLDFLEAGGIIKKELLANLKKCELDNGNVYDVLEGEMDKKIPMRVRVTISKRMINKYIPVDMTSKEIQQLIESLLCEWSQKK